MLASAAHDSWTQLVRSSSHQVPHQDDDHDDFTTIKEFSKLPDDTQKIAWFGFRSFSHDLILMLAIVACYLCFSFRIVRI